MTKATSAAIRLKAIRMEAGVSLREMARRLGMAPSTYGHYEDPDRFKEPFLPMDLARRIAVQLETEGASKEILAIAGVDESPNTPTHVDLGEPAPNGTALVPVFDVTASAGPGALNEYEPQTHSLAFPPDYLHTITSGSTNTLAIITVKGDSMEPTLPHNAIVMLDTNKQNLGFDGLFVIRMDDTLHVKRIGRSAKDGCIYVMSDNPAHRDMDIPKSKIEPIGKVLWYGRKV